MFRVLKALTNVLLVVLWVPLSASASIYYQDSSGSLVIEAEHFEMNLAMNGQSWSLVAGPSTSSGEVAMAALPDNGLNLNSNYIDNSPLISNQAYFNLTGTYYVWLRGYASGSSSNDSVHVGLDGFSSNSSDRIKFNSASSWVWSNDTMDAVRATIEIHDVGVHSIDLWMREDGVYIDKVIITNDPDFIPSGNGPAESSTTPPTPPQDSDGDGLGDLWETENNLDPSVPDDTGSDSDGDGLSLLAEYQHNTNPVLADTDSDQMPDGFEVQYQFDPLSPVDANDDLDSDGLSNLEEYLLGTDPSVKNPRPDSTFQQEDLENGLLVIEAEDFQIVESVGQSEWVEVTQPENASGNVAMLAHPNDGSNIKENYDTLSPKLEYGAYFVKTGAHYLWLRGHAQGSSGNDSVHAGFNGVAQNSLKSIEFNSSSDWYWSSTTRAGSQAVFNVPTVGEHKINLWFREDGVIIDKIIITSDPNFIPSGYGPGSSPLLVDTDKDGFPDFWEDQYGLNSLVADNPESDDDFDGLSLYAEHQESTNPLIADTDADGIPDGFEVQYQLDPLNGADASADPDNDGYNNLREFQLLQDPFQADPGQFPGEEPTSLKASSTASDISLTWLDNSIDELGFELQRKHNGGDWEVFQLIQENQTSFVDDTISVGNTYSYRIAAYNEVGLSSFSNIDTVVVEYSTLVPINFVPRIGHVDGDYGLVRYGKPTEVDYVVPSGSGRLVIFGVSYEQNTDGVLAKNNYIEDGQTQEDKTIDTVSYGGVPLTRIKYTKTLKHLDGHNNHIELWALSEQQLAGIEHTEWEVTWFEEIDDNNNLRGFVATYNNVDQLQPFTDVQSIATNGTDGTVSLELSTDEGGVLFAQATQGNSGTAAWGNGLIEQFDLSFSGVNVSLATMNTAGNPVFPTVQLAGYTERRAMISVSLKPAIRTIYSDNDEDNVDDGWEALHGYDSNNALDASFDTDSDGLITLEEFELGGDPNNPDTDFDGIPDGYEVAHGLAFLDPSDALLDPDLDGVTTLDEYHAGTDPFVSDLDYWDNINIAVGAGEPFTLIDFGANLTIGADDQGRAWNNYKVYSNDGSVNTLLNILGGSTGITLGTTSAFSGASTGNGVTTGSRYLDSVSGDYLWSGATGTESGEVIFSNLRASETFTFVLYGSRNGLGESRKARYTLSGADTVTDTLQAIENEENIVVLAVQPNAQGQVVLQVNAESPDVRAHLNAVEIILGDYAPADSDGDGIQDAWELLYNYNPNDASDASLDLDSDGLTVLEEFLNGSDPTNSDTDNDGIPDGYEVENGLDLLNPADAILDPDSDGVSSLDEYLSGTNPNVSDIDLWSNIDINVLPGDSFALVDFGATNTTALDDLDREWNNYAYSSTGSSLMTLNNILGDSTGVKIATSSSFSGASTSNGVITGSRYSLDSVKSDYLWVGNSGTETGTLVFSNLLPSETFTFVIYGSRNDIGDSRIGRYTLTGASSTSKSLQAIGNQNEVVIIAIQPNALGQVELQVNAEAPDVRAHINAIEIILGNYAPVDSDGDGIQDAWETLYGYDPYDSSDANLDLDSDNLTTLEEYILGGDPGKADSDEDGIPDGYEVANGLDLLNPSDAGLDPDSDGVSTLDEYLAGTNPFHSDIDYWDSINISVQTGEPFALIDFGAALTESLDEHGRAWNNFSVPGVSNSSITLSNVLGVSTGITVQTISAFSGASTGNGITSGSRYSLNSVKSDYLWVGANGSETGKLVISNLPLGETFTFSLFGSRNDVGDSRLTRYTLIGENSDSGTLQAIGNQDYVVNLTVQPDALGQVELQVIAENPDIRGHLNAIEVVLGATAY